MSEIAGRSFFGYGSKCNDLKEVVAFLRDIIGDEATKGTVAFGMLLAANSTEGGKYRDDALAVLNCLAYAKAELDSAQCHTFPTIEVKSDILFSAQRYADENTIPCTECHFRHSPILAARRTFPWKGCDAAGRMSVSAKTKPKSRACADSSR